MRMLPSVNEKYRTAFRYGHANFYVDKRVKRLEYIEKKRVQRQVQAKHWIVRPTDRYILHLTFWFAVDNADLDNPLKLTLDALTKGGAIFDDHLIEKISFGNKRIGGEEQWARIVIYRRCLDTDQVQSPDLSALQQQQQQQIIPEQTACLQATRKGKPARTHSGTRKDMHTDGRSEPNHNTAQHTLDRFNRAGSRHSRSGTGQSRRFAIAGEVS